MRFTSLTLAAALTSGVFAQDDVVSAIEMTGRASDGEKSLEGVSVYVLTGNERTDSVVTKSSGKFGLMLDLQKEHMIEFRKEGYMTKRMLIDLRVKARPGQELVLAPLDMDVTLLNEKFYDGADTDVLDFPSAIVRWDKTLRGFAVDQTYTMGMARANGSVLLVAARSEKKK